MAFGTNTVWDVRYGGSDANNGGGFNPGSSGFATDLTTDTNTGNTASPVVSSASYNFVAGDVGAWLFIKSGTNWTPGWYQIASVASNKATLSAAAGAGITYVLNKPAAVTTAAGCATVGTPTSGTWGIDYSQQDAAEITFTDMVIGGTTTQFTSAGNPVGKNFVGNIINITSGTGFTVQRVEVVSTSGTTATCDKSLGTGGSTGGNGGFGGALGTPGQAGALQVAGCTVAWKRNASDYVMSSSTNNVSGGKVTVLAGSGTDTPTVWFGYDTNRHVTNRDANRPTLKVNAQTSLTMFNGAVNYTNSRNFIVDGNGQTAIIGAYLGGNYQKSDSIKAKNCTSYGLQCLPGNNPTQWGHEATGCSGSAGIYCGGAGAIAFCEAYDNTCPGFECSASGIAIYCIADSNTIGFYSTSIGCSTFHCTAYGNSSHGFALQNSVGCCLAMNCIAESNGGYGYAGTSSAGLISLVNCAGYNNTSGNYSVTAHVNVFGFVEQTAGSFFNDAAAGDFSLNATPGQGALLRATAHPGTFMRGTTNSDSDIGAAQHQDSGAGSTTIAFTGIIGG